jgi:hypothetical protein
LAFPLLILPGSQAFSDEERPRVEQVALAHIPAFPLMSLPGMRSFPQETSRAAEALPQPVISDVINIPNPFDSRKPGREGQTEIAYRLDRDVPVTVTLYDLLGFRVRRWQFAMGQSGGRQGVNSFLWDGTNETGRKVSKGGYLAQIEIELPGTVVTTIRKIGVIH